MDAEVRSLTNDQPTARGNADGATVARVQPTELTPAQRRRLIRTAARYAEAGERFRTELEAIIADGASLAAIARELGVSRQAVHQRLKRGEDT